MRICLEVYRKEEGQVEAGQVESQGQGSTDQVAGPGVRACCSYRNNEIRADERNKPEIEQRKYLKLIVCSSAKRAG